MRIKYTDHNFRGSSLEVIAQANEICEEYSAAGLALTLRQLYYQFVARDLVENSQKSYDRIGSIVAKARLAGLFDWAFIVDRTRNLEKRTTWTSPEALIADAADAYLTDTWAPQKTRVEVWIEKDAAIGVIERVCHLNNVPYFSCRGYTSATEMWEAGVRIGEYLRNGERTVLLHIGDHDPSGLDMTRDIEDRIRLFVHKDWVNEFYGSGSLIGTSLSRGQIRQSMRQVMRDKGGFIADDEMPFEVRRIALTYDQVLQYGPPPNFAKETDSRFVEYQATTGLDESWELDALEPFVMETLIQDHIDGLVRAPERDAAEREQELDRKVLVAVKENWETIKTVHAPKEAPK
jgi:hypothetical protein